jgi:hypothetical protein
MVEISGGSELAEALKKLSGKVSNAASVEIGFPKGSLEDDGTSTPMVAAIQEFGAPSKNIPPRPFFRNMIAKESPGWPDRIANYLKTHNFDAAQALGDIGDVIASELRQSIHDTNAPALSALTVMMRGMRRQARYKDMPFGQLIKEAVKRVAAGKTNYGASTKPLIDTGIMLQSIVSIVNTDEGETS